MYQKHCIYLSMNCILNKLNFVILICAFYRTSIHDFDKFYRRTKPKMKLTSFSRKMYRYQLKRNKEEPKML